MIFIGRKIGVLVLKLKASTANMVIFRFLRCPSHKYESFHSKRIIPLGDRGLFPMFVCSIWCCDMLETLRPPLAEFHCTPHQICCSIWYCDIDGTFLQPRKTDSIQISPSWEWNICLTVVVINIAVMTSITGQIDKFSETASGFTLTHSVVSRKSIL